MPRRLRDAAATALMLIVLFGVLMAVSPTVRERVAQVTSGKGGQLVEPEHIVSKVMTSTGASAARYASNNTYMVGFLIVAGLLFVLMLRT